MQIVGYRACCSNNNSRPTASKRGSLYVYIYVCLMVAVCYIFVFFFIFFTLTYLNHIYGAFGGWQRAFVCVCVRVDAEETKSERDREWEGNEGEFLHTKTHTHTHSDRATHADMFAVTAPSICNTHSSVYHTDHARIFVCAGFVVVAAIYFVSLHSVICTLFVVVVL